MAINAAFAAVLVVIPFATSGAVAHGPDPTFSGTFAANQELRFRWRAGSEPTAVIKAAITKKQDDPVELQKLNARPLWMRLRDSAARLMLPYL